MKLIVGFGNPGEKFANNRQNIGFKVIDILANNENIEVRIKKKKSVIGRGKIYKHDVVLLKPQTFINLIGESVLYIASFLRIDVKDIICIVEDPSLNLGDLRIDYMQSDLRNIGVDSMALALKSDKFAKVRVGVGECPEGMKMDDFLLQDFTFDENLLLIDVLNKTEQAVRMLITKSIEDVQNRYNPEGAPKIKKRQVKAIHIDHRKLQKNS